MLRLLLAFLIVTSPAFAQTDSVATAMPAPDVSLIIESLHDTIDLQQAQIDRIANQLANQKLENDMLSRRLADANNKNALLSTYAKTGILSAGHELMSADDITKIDCAAIKHIIEAAQALDASPEVTAFIHDANTIIEAAATVAEADRYVTGEFYSEQKNDSLTNRIEKLLAAETFSDAQRQQIDTLYNRTRFYRLAILVFEETVNGINDYFNSKEMSKLKPALAREDINNYLYSDNLPDKENTEARKQILDNINDINNYPVVSQMLDEYINAMCHNRVDTCESIISKINQALNAESQNNNTDINSHADTNSI